MSGSENPAPKSATSHLHVMNLVVALLAGIISITGGIYSLKSNLFSGPAYGSLQGTVRDERIARPLKFASVEISDLSGAVVNSAATDDDGHYLMKSIPVGNYVVKFTAPIHKVETKSIRIEKNLESTINVDLIPEEQSKVSVNELKATGQNMPSYAPFPAQSAVPPASDVSPPPSTPTGYPQGTTSPNPQTYGYRRHHRTYTGVPTDSNTSSTSSQGSVLAQAGTQLLEAWLSKKSQSSSSSSSSSSSN